MPFAEVRTILTDSTCDRQRRLLRHKGQRGAHVEQGIAAELAIRIGPAQCAISGLLTIMTTSPGLYAVLGVTSVVGVVCQRHPVEWVYTWRAVRNGRVPPATQPRCPPIHLIARNSDDQRVPSIRALHRPARCRTCSLPIASARHRLYHPPATAMRMD